MTATLPSAVTDHSSRKPVDRQELSTRLLGSAAKKSYDPVVDIDWAAPIPTQLYGLYRNGRRCTARRRGIH